MSCGVSKCRIFDNDDFRPSSIFSKNKIKDSLEYLLTDLRPDARAGVIMIGVVLSTRYGIKEKRVLLVNQLGYNLAILYRPTNSFNYLICIFLLL